VIAGHDSAKVLSLYSGSVVASATVRQEPIRVPSGVEVQVVPASVAPLVRLAETDEQHSRASDVRLRDRAASIVNTSKALSGQ